MDLKQLEYFAAVAKHSSLTAAAEELYTTQPHVSLVIKSLEKELGVKLFRRLSKGVELTDDGYRIYSYALNALKNTDLIVEACCENPGSWLRVASNHSSFMANVTASYFQKHAGTDLHLQYTECGTEELLNIVSEQKYDIGFMFMPIHSHSALQHMAERRRLEFVPLLTTDLVVFVGEKHPLYNRSSITREEIAELDFIQLDDDYFTLDEILKSLPGSSAHPIKVHKLVRTNSINMMNRMLNHGDLCNLSTFWNKDTDRDPSYKKLTIEGMEGQISFGYLKHSHHPLRPHAQALVQEIIDNTCEKGRL